MGIFDLLKNTVEGTAQVAVNAVKLPVGVVIAPLDDGKSIAEAASGIVEGVNKIGDAEQPHDR
jgi:hypothetical protein